MLEIERDPSDERRRSDRRAQRRRGLLQCRPLRGGDQIEIERSGLQERHIRLRIGDDADVDALDLRRATPIAGIRGVEQPVAARPRDERKRPVADRGSGIEGRTRERALRGENVFRQHVLRVRAVREERRHGGRPRFAEMNANRQRIRRLRTIDQIVAFVRRHRVRGIENGVEREEHVFRRNRHAVAPADAGPQMVDEGATVGREPAVGHGRDFAQQLRDGAARCVEIEERLEGEMRERLLDVARVGVGEEGVEIRRVGGDIEAHGGDRRRRGVSARGGRETERQERGPAPKPCRHCAHVHRP